MQSTNIMKRQNYSISVLVFTAGLLILGACDKADPIASYVYVPKMEFAAGSGQGSSLQDFPIIYAYANGKLLGLYPVPGLIPIIASGSTDMVFFPGIFRFGIKSLPDIYPAALRIDKLIDLQPTEVDTFTPVFTYDPKVNVLLTEDFESNGSVFSNTIQGTPLSLSAESVFEGSKAGLLFADTLKPVTEVSSIPLSGIPDDNSRRVYIEMNYKTETPMAVGLRGFNNNSSLSETYYIVVLNPTDTWKKAYIDVTTEIVTLKYDNYQILLQTGLAFTANGYEKLQAKAFVDNIKLLY